jgi:hypothetical protein
VAGRFISSSAETEHSIPVLQITWLKGYRPIPMEAGQNIPDHVFPWPWFIRKRFVHGRKQAAGKWKSNAFQEKKNAGLLKKGWREKAEGKQKGLKPV